MFELAVDKHTRYFKYALSMLPSTMAQLDATRMTLGHLCLVGLAALGKLETAFSASDRQGMIEWIYEQQVTPTANNDNAAYCGFRGGSLFGPHESCTYAASNMGNVAATYSAIASLVLLGDDLSRVDRRAVTGALRHLQLGSGTFAPHPGTTESDPRFIYCACAVSALLDDWSGVDCARAAKYISACVNVDGGLSQAALHESHGGHFYCCVASLQLMGRMDALGDERMRRRTVQWAMMRMNDGYQGRANKPSDVCYSFWVGAGVEMLGGHGFVDAEALAAFTAQCESPYGGIGKAPGANPDPLHSALGIVGLTFFCPEFPAMDPALLLPRELVAKLHVRTASGQAI
ncbi:geranylgeranyl transferase type-1 subunit beta [Coemansia interrupta]|uniref:Geranylgeranyl transferase type-1 subunit beta n=1 Tax=Coemansia interrupta TaxID=1126814 RepID=A0A9W8HSX1_9FUNG|nr:geranylgeranyl transferase type-1 subunit beta [Coemansia interrupta]